MKTIRILLAVLGYLGVSILSVQAQETTGAEKCSIGVYVISLYNLNFNNNTFDAAIWFWSNCATEQRQPLKTMDFVNSSNAVGSLDTTFPRQNGYWSARKVIGTFRHNWDLRNFPFDRHTVEIVTEAGDYDTHSLIYEADVLNSTYDPQMDIPGWRIAHFQVAAGTKVYRTTFGDPELPQGSSSEWAQLRVMLTIQRMEWITFFKVTGGVYAAFALAFFGYFLQGNGVLGTRLGLFVGATFATVLNFTGDKRLGTSISLTLIDWIHIITLLYIVAAVSMVVAVSRMIDHGRESAAQRLHNYSLVIVTSLFVLVNVALIVGAAKGG